MDRGGNPPSEGNGDDVARLVALTERQHQLWGLLRDATEEDARNQLFDELARNREELARLRERVSAQVELPPAPAPPAPAVPAEEDAGSPRSVGEDLRARLLTPPENVAPATPPPPPAPPAASSPPPTVETPAPVDRPHHPGN